MSHQSPHRRVRSVKVTLASSCLGLAATISGALGFARPAQAEVAPSLSGGAAEQCLQAYSDGQRARKRGEFRKARELLALCGGVSCPTALHGDCQRWLSEVETATPTSVFRVVSSKGEELQDVQLAVDGGPAQVLDGRAVQFDPGEHTLEFTAPGHRPLRRQHSFVEGEKLVIHTVELQSLESSVQAGPEGPGDTSSAGEATSGTTSEAASALPESGSSTVPLWLGVGAAAMGAGGFTYFGIEARADEKALSSCSPNCTNARVEQVEREYLLANISLGVGVVGLLGAAAWLVFTPGQSRSSSSAGGWELRVDGNSATIFGRF